RLMATDGAPEDRRRRAAFNLFWTAKTVCKLRRLKWITCSAEVLQSMRRRSKNTLYMNRFG
ncbi:MAG: hypothetical protein ACTS53_02105, partial [Candidatus Hodgkinia cicadicola]